MVTRKDIEALEAKIHSWAAQSAQPNAQVLADEILDWTENAKDFLEAGDDTGAENAFNNALGDFEDLEKKEACDSHS